MAKYKNKYRIESNRARFWDYSAPADYFITICILDRKEILGHVENGKMILSEYGKIVESEIKKIPEYHQRVKMDVWVVMPNHIHILVTLGDYGYNNGISLIGNGKRDGAGNGMDGGNCGMNVEKIHEFSLPWQNRWWNNPQYKPTIDEIKQYRKHRRKMLIPKILGKFQQQTSKKINIIRKTPGTKNWQPNYHDHIIRNNKSYQNIRNYIINNPKKWDQDKFNADNG